VMIDECVYCQVSGAPGGARRSGLGVSGQHAQVAGEADALLPF